ncbi:MAG: ATP-binding cassette domain-containing protein, partial [Kiritimatiellia bacterium]
EHSIFPQDPNEILQPPETPAMDWLRCYAEDKDITETDLRSFMGRMLFSKDDVFKPLHVLSGGEKARLILAKMMQESGNVLFLDEPTNHLDLESIEALNYALDQFPNTIVFVSHDHRLIRSLATRILEIKDGKIHDRIADETST